MLPRAMDAKLARAPENRIRRDIFVPAPIGVRQRRLFAEIQGVALQNVGDVDPLPRIVRV